MAIDEARLGELLGRFVSDLGATMHAGSMAIGHRLGLYRALATAPVTVAELAGRTGCRERYLVEWLRGQVAGGYVSVTGSDTGSDTDGGEVYFLDDEQAFTLTDPDNGAYLPGAFVFALGALRAEPQLAEAFRSGAGIGWHEHHDDVFVGCEQFFRPGYVAHLVASWIPALDGVVAKLQRGGTVADVGCGLGASAVLIAEAFPRATVVGSDYHGVSIALAQTRAAAAGLAERVTFEIASAQEFTATEVDLVTTFDCLHDMGDPVGAARHVRAALAPDGTWMIVEPFAGDDYTDNLNPLGRASYGFSTFLCVPNALSQTGGSALGAQAGEPAIRKVVHDGGFSRFRRVAQTPFHLVYEARP